VREEGAPERTGRSVRPRARPSRYSQRLTGNKSMGRRSQSPRRNEKEDKKVLEAISPGEKRATLYREGKRRAKTDEQRGRGLEKKHAPADDLAPAQYRGASQKQLKKSSHEGGRRVN